MNRVPLFRGRQGYILQEIIVGLVIFAIAMLPVMRGFRMLPQIGSALAQQSRREAWRSAADEAILQGVDPRQTPVMHAITDFQAPSEMMGTVDRRELSPRVGRPQITVLSMALQDTAEERGVPAGFEIGAGSVPTPPREDPLPPLTPIKLSAPLLNPSSGTMVPILSLSAPTGPTDPYLLILRAQSSAASELVHLRTTAPEVRTQSGLGSALVELNAVELAQSVRGQTWSEYAGDVATDTRVTLSDGRIRWLVKEGGRTQVYEPSDALDFILGLDVGRPTYSVGGVEYPSGETVPIDYAQALAIGTGRVEATLTYPANVRERFGSQWSTVEPSFTWNFGSYPGDSSAGNTVSFFRPAGRVLWSSNQTLSATPSGLPGIRPLTGTWTIQRQATELAPPERVASFYDGSTDAPGLADFTAPLVPAINARIGRPQVNGVESVTDTISVPLVP